MTGRVRQKPASVGNVVPLHAPMETTEDIIRDVEQRSKQQNAFITDRLQSMVESMEQRHRERARECLPIGYAMSRPTLDNWIEIGVRMLGTPGGRL